MQLTEPQWSGFCLGLTVEQVRNPRFNQSMLTAIGRLKKDGDLSAENICARLLQLDDAKLAGCYIGLTLNEVDVPSFDARLLGAIAVLQEQDPSLEASKAYQKLVHLNEAQLDNVRSGRSVGQPFDKGLHPGLNTGKPSSSLREVKQAESYKEAANSKV